MKANRAPIDHDENRADGIKTSVGKSIADTRRSTLECAIDKPFGGQVWSKTARGAGPGPSGRPAGL